MHKALSLTLGWERYGNGKKDNIVGIPESHTWPAQGIAICILGVVLKSTMVCLCSVGSPLVPAAGRDEADSSWGHSIPRSSRRKQTWIGAEEKSSTMRNISQEQGITASGVVGQRFQGPLRWQRFWGGWTPV